MALLQGQRRVPNRRQLATVRRFRKSNQVLVEISNKDLIRVLSPAVDLVRQDAATEKKANTFTHSPADPELIHFVRMFNFFRMFVS